MKDKRFNGYGFSEANDGKVVFDYRQRYGVGREPETKTVHGHYSQEEQERDWKRFVVDTIHNEHDITEKHVTDEHEITKQHVTDEHNQTKTHVSNEAASTRATVQSAKQEINQKISNVQSTLDSVSSRVGSILGWVNSQ